MAINKRSTSELLTLKMYDALYKLIQMTGVDAEYRTVDEEGIPQTFNIKCTFVKASSQEAEIVNDYGSYSRIVTIAYNVSFEPIRFDTLVVNGAKYTVVSSVRLTAPDGIIGYKCYCNGEGR